MPDDETPQPSEMDAAANPASWINAADGLLKSAETLWSAKVAPFWSAYLREIDELNARGAEELTLSEETQRLFSESMSYQLPALLLSGFAIENALKAIRVQQLALRGEKPFRRTNKGRFLLPELLTHDLVTLAARCDLKLEREEQSLLRRMQETIQWGGRYPVRAGVAAGATDPGATLKVVVEGQQDDCRKMYQRLIGELSGLRG